MASSYFFIQKMGAYREQLSHLSTTLAMDLHMPVFSSSSSLLTCQRPAPSFLYMITFSSPSPWLPSFSPLPLYHQSFLHVLHSCQWMNKTRALLQDGGSLPWPSSCPFADALQQTSPKSHPQLLHPFTPQLTPNGFSSMTLQKLFFSESPVISMWPNPIVTLLFPYLSAC